MASTFCRVCLRKPRDFTDGTGVLAINQSQLNMLTFIGDSSKIIRFDGTTPSLCVKCSTDLDSVFDFVMKLKRSTKNLKEERVVTSEGEVDPLTPSSEYNARKNAELKIEDCGGSPDKEPNKIVDVKLKTETPSSSSHESPLRYEDPVESKSASESYWDSQLKVGAVLEIPFSIIQPKSESTYELRTSLQLKSEEMPKQIKVELEPVSNTQDLDKDKPLFACHMCHKRFDLLVSLQLHLKLHNVGRPFQCDYCGMTLMFRRNLIEHLKKHCNPKHETTAFTTKITGGHGRIEPDQNSCESKTH